jgi:hypothetical protein
MTGSYDGRCVRCCTCPTTAGMPGEVFRLEGDPGPRVEPCRCGCRCTPRRSRDDDSLLRDLRAAVARQMTWPRPKPGKEFGRGHTFPRKPR